MAVYHEEDLLIIAKTYPEPSTKYRETTCVGAINAQGEIRRLYPVPFRLLEGEQRFKKWEWIHARVARKNDDHRPESRRIDVDSIQRTSWLSAGKGWTERMRWLTPHTVESFSALESRRKASGETMGFVRPARLLGLDIIPASEPEWTPKDLENLQREGLFDAADSRKRPLLRKVPHGFHYRYVCVGPDGHEEEFRHKITDWEAGALYWHCVRSHGTNWENPFRQRMEIEMIDKDLVFFLGTIHRFPDQWLIVGLIYPPKPAALEQQDLPLSWD